MKHETTLLKHPIQEIHHVLNIAFLGLPFHLQAPLYGEVRGIIFPPEPMP